MPQEESVRILAILAAVPRGRVTSYGRVAELAGVPNGARRVVRLLHSSAEKAGIPWHRILRKDGSIAIPEGEGRELQRALLEAEGVVVGAGGRVELSRYLWPRPGEILTSG